MLENGLIRYEFDADGRLTRAFDKEAGREVLPPELPATSFRSTSSARTTMRRGISKFSTSSRSAARRRASNRRAAGAARVRSGLEFRLGIGNSRLVQRVTLAEGSKRLDFATEAEWHEERKMLRVAFPVAVFTEEANFDIQYGTVRRPTHRNTSWDAAASRSAARNLRTCRRSFTARRC